MSVTFTVPNAPFTTVPCEFCAQEREWAAEEGREVEVNEHGGCCDPWCNGTQEVPEAPEVNLANTNACGVLDLLGLPAEAMGQAPVSAFRRGLLRAMNTDRSHMEREPSDTPGGWAGTVVVKGEDGVTRIERRGPRIIDGGNTDEQTVRRLTALQNLCQWAEDNGFETICWG